MSAVKHTAARGPKNTYLIVILFLTACLTEQAFSRVHLSLKGSAVSSNFGLQSQAKDSVSGSVDFDVGRHLRLGVTHRVERTRSEGYTEVAEGSYYFSATNVLATANSLDLTVILFYGQLFLPYLKLGMIKKNYKYILENLEGESDTISLSTEPLPNMGAGLGIQLSARFSLNLSHSISPGYTIANPAVSDEATAAWDSVSSVGITYKL